MYQHYGVIIIVIVMKFYGTNIYARPGQGTSKSRIPFKLHNNSVLGILPTAQRSKAFSSEFVQFLVAYLLSNPLVRK